MSRSINANIVSALSNPEIEPFYAVRLDFATAAIYLWTGYGDKTINSQTYIGSGNLLSIDGLEEVNDLSTAGTSLVLNGMDSTILNYALTEEYQGREVNIYWGVGGVSEVVEVFSGYMDQMTIVDKGDTSTIKLSVESKLIVLERPNIRRYTEGSHSSVIATEGYSNSNDSFFRWVAKLQDVQVAWGRETETSDETS